MRILIVSHYFYPHKGGIEVVVYNQAKELVKMGHEVTVVCSRMNNEAKFEIINGINIIRIPASNILESNFGIPFPFFSPTLITILAKLIKNNDIIHIHEIFYLSSLVATIIAKHTNKRLILTQHIRGVFNQGEILKIIQNIILATYGKYIINSSQRIIVCNKSVGDWLNVSNKTVLIRNGVDLDLFSVTSNKNNLRKKYNLPIDRKIVLFVGRLVKKKGFDRLYYAKDPDYLIIFAGYGKMPDFMKTNENVLFLGEMNQEDLCELYKLSDVFCLPSSNEGFPLSILEAMASGLPIICFYNPGYEDYLNTKDSIMLQQNSSAKKVKSAIKFILSDAKLRRSMGIYARKKILFELGWSQNVNALLKVYNNLLQYEKKDNSKKN